MKVLTGILSLMVVAGCATVELASTEDAYKDKWVRVTEGDMDEDSGWKRVKLYVADDSFLGEAGDFGHFVASNGLPDYLYVFGSSQFRTAYSKRGQIYEWTTNPYVLKKTYSWQNYPHELPAAATTGKPTTPVVVKPKPGPPEPAVTPSTPSSPSSGAQSAYETGLKYQYGDGVEQSDAEAAKWFRKAADQGHADAQYQLGVMCQNGWGVAKDEGEAQRWFRQAANQGHAQAQAKLSDSEPAPPAPKPEPKPKPEPQPAPASSQGSTGMPRMPD